MSSRCPHLPTLPLRKVGGTGQFYAGREVFEEIYQTNFWCGIRVGLGEEEEEGEPVG